MVTIQQFSSEMKMKGESTGGIYAIEVTAQKLSAISMDATYADFFAFMRVENGRATYSINSRLYQLEPGTLMVLTPRQLVLIEDFTADFRATYILVEVSLMEKIFTHHVECKVLTDRLILGHVPILGDAPSHSAIAADTMHLMLQLQQAEGIGARESLQAGYLRNLAFLVSDALLGREQPAGICHQEVIYRQFIALVSTHFMQEHSTRFYAGKLCITPVYLARIVRRYSQKSVKEFILSLVYHEALDLLRFTDHQVGEIARQLGFPDTETFCKFFKKRNGEPPSAFLGKGEEGKVKAVSCNGNCRNSGWQLP